MNILTVHNFYQHAGGEDLVFRQEIELLRNNAHKVITYELSNDEINPLNKIHLAQMTFWNKKVYKDIEDLVLREKLEIVHFHNTFPLISPAGYYAAKKCGAKVVQTLHNFRTICPSAILFRSGFPCEDCVGKFFAYPAILHACYRNSRSASSITALMLAAHRMINTWNSQIDAYIAVTKFSRNKYIQGGLPPEKMFIRSNYLPINRNFETIQRHGYIYAGRLTIEKGVNAIVNTWKQYPNLECIKIFGSGPLSNQCFAEAKKTNNIKISSWVEHDELMKEIQKSRAIIFPSLWYEVFGMVILEAFSTGTPVIASNIGAMAEIVRDGYTGLLFHPGDSDDLALKVKWASEHPEEMAIMGQNAHAEYKAKYTAEIAYALLMDIYEQILTRKQTTNP